MGLDITAYKNLSVYEMTVLDNDELPEGVVVFHKSTIDWTERNWQGRTAGVQADTPYTYEDDFGFRAGSYGGYNEWRRKLALFAGYPDAASVWNKSVPYGAFAELIDFADNEGVIGSVVAAKLAKDFRDNLERAKAYSVDGSEEANQWFLESYQNWLKAFEMAADNGAVDFH